MSIDQAAAQPPDPPEEGVIPQPGPVTVYVMLAVRSLTVITQNCDAAAVHCTIVEYLARFPCSFQFRS